MGYRKPSRGENSKAPGPGQYDPKIDYAKENIGGVKIGTSLRDSKNMISGGAPGPGNYNITGSLGGPAFGIGSSNRA
jgi:hypothetical protein